MLIREEVLKEYATEVLDSDVENVLWVKMSKGQEEESLVLAVCYIPPESSRWEGEGGGGLAFLGRTGSQVPLAGSSDTLW